MSKFHLLSVASDAKTIKGEAKGYLTGILYLAPADLSGWNVCPKATAGCRAACLGWHAGRVAMESDAKPVGIKAARLRKTRLFFEDRATFMAQLVEDIANLCRKAAKLGMIPCVRLNGSSDIRWERIRLTAHEVSAGGGLTTDGEVCDTRWSPRDNIMAAFPSVNFYDYTKIANRRDLPPNYRLVFSLAEDNEQDAIKAVDAGMNVSVVFRKAKPDHYWLCSKHGPMDDRYLPVIDGDADDLRFLDPHPVVVGLVAKGAAKRDRSGFVRG